MNARTLLDSILEGEDPAVERIAKRSYEANRSGKWEDASPGEREYELYYARAEARRSGKRASLTPEYEDLGTFTAMHGSPSKFRKFNEERIRHFGFHLGTREQAATFGDPKPYRVTLHHALRLPDLGTWSFEIVAAALRERGLLPTAAYEKAWSTSNPSDALRKALMKKGVDGIVYENEVEGNGDSYLVFSSDQIQPA